jgi:hypothetical protein
LFSSIIFSLTRPPGLGKLFANVAVAGQAMCDIAADRARKLLQKEEAAKGGS